MSGKSILFVDDEEMILKGLKRMLHKYSKEWDMRFALGAEVALKMLNEQEVNVVVTDMKMPGMSGVELMEKIKTLYPHTVRIVLSGHSEKEDVIKSIKLAHQYLAKPVESEKLISVIEQTYYLNTVLKDKEVKRVVATIEALPALPTTYNKIMKELESDDFSLKNIGAIVSQDIGTSTNILKQVNSSFWGLTSKVQTPDQAVNLLGADIIKSLVLKHHIFSLYEDIGSDIFSISDMEKKAILSSQFSKIISTELKLEKELQDSAFIATMLQDVGILILLTNFPKTYNVVLDELKKNEGYSLRQAELSVMGVSHAEIGAYLLGIWGMNFEVVSAIAMHHSPKVLDKRTDLVTFISYLSNAIYETLNDDIFNMPDDMDIDRVYLANIGMLEKIDTFYEKCREVMEEVDNG